jgi:hypothetical protein
MFNTIKKVKAHKELRIKDNKQKNKEYNTLDIKYKEMNNYLKNKKTTLNDISKELDSIKEELDILEKNKEHFTLNEIKKNSILLDRKCYLEDQYKLISSNSEIMDYYDMVGDVITSYYINKDNNDNQFIETKNILDFLSNTKRVKKNNLMEKYCQRIDGIRINHDDGSNRIKYCDECDVEKILDITESAYICPCCGDTENVILDEDKQIKDYSPYRRLNHFKEWLNQFQAKQNPDISEQVFVDIIKELNKIRFNDLSKLNKNNMKAILKKLNYNIYYEHVAYIINKLNNLDPPRITRDMERLFINMFYKIQEPWENNKQQSRKNFLSYSYVLHKFCELLDLDHLLGCFPLHKDSNKIIENDNIWEKICRQLHWEFIPSFT